MGCLSSGNTSSSKTKMKLGPEGKQLWSLALPGATERLQRAGEAYTGPLVAALSEYEQKGLDTLNEYLGSAMPTESPLYAAGEEEILKTLQGTDYDPVNSEYYKAYRNQVMRELSEAKDRLASRASAGDKLFGGGRIATEGKMEEGAVGNMAVLLGQMQERERERRLGSVGEALKYLSFGEQAPIQRVQAAEELGALPRQIEQAQMTADYQEWLRELTDLGVPLDVATALAAKTGVTSTNAFAREGTNWGQLFAAGLPLLL